MSLIVVDRVGNPELSRKRLSTDSSGEEEDLTAARWARLVM
jgi:hypothetical protein